VRRTLKAVVLSLPLAASGGCATASGSTAPDAPAARAGAPVEAAPAAAPASSPAAAVSPAQEAALQELVEAYFEASLRLNPVRATIIGDNRYNHLWADSLSDAHRAERRALTERSLAAARAIDAAQLGPQARLTHTIFVRRMESDLAEDRFPSHLLPLNQMRSEPNTLVQLGSGKGAQPFKTVADYEAFLQRADGFVVWVDTAIARMREGVQKGVVLPRVLVERTLPQLAAQVVPRPEESLFFGPVKDFPAAVPAAERERLMRAYREAISRRLVPAYKKLHDYMKAEYLPKARATVGLSVLPDGQAWYAHAARESTTTDTTPEQLHQLGLAEVKRIHAQMDGVLKEVGFTGDREAFEAHLLTLPQLRFKSREDMLARFRETKRRVDAVIPKLFSLIPKQDYEVRPVEAFREKSAAIGSYQSASPDGTRPGIFYLNTRDWADASAANMETLTLHEGAPGHHFQSSVQQTLEHLPRIRRFSGYTAYSEGWGLYSETLGPELGLYTDPYQRYGYLSSELWRAIRLVLDTGLHAKGWTREQAIAYGKENGTRSDAQTQAEVERFIAMPGQALAYKVGQLKLTELRARAQERLGARFDVKAFHKEVLEDGALPLDVLEEKLARWVASQAGTAARR
jgi:uncharacterized protein (DUF885 family)